MQDYDKLIDQDIEQGASSEPAKDLYGPLIDVDKQRQDGALRVSLGAALNANPDKAAAAKQLASATGYPLDVVERNQDQVEREVQMKRLQALSVSSPVLARQLADPEFAKLSHDDADNLSGLEKTLKFMGNLGKAGASAIPSMSYGAAGLFAAGAEMAAPWLEPLAGTILPENPLTRVAQGFRSMGAQAKSDADALMPRADGNIEAGVYSGIQSVAQNIPALAAGLISGNPQLALTGLTLPVVGQGYESARARGLVPAQAAMYGLSQGAVEYATEAVPVGRLFRDLGAGQSLLRTAANQLIPEIVGEQIATHVQDFNEWVTLNPEKPSSDYLASRPDAAVQTLVATLVAVGAQTSIGKGLDAAMRRSTDREQQAQQSEQTAQAIADLNKLAAASKVRARDAQTFEQFVQHASQDGQVQDLFISAQTLAQSGLAEQVAAASPSVQQQYAQALETGGDIRIPLAEYAANIAPEGYAQSLVEHLKADPLGFSQAEARDYLANRDTILEQEVNQALDAQEGDAAFKASQQAVQQTILGQLQGARRFTDDVNQQYATLTSAFYGVQAARLGVTPEDLYQRFPLQILAQQPLQGAVLEQAEASAAQKAGDAWRAELAKVSPRDMNYVPQMGTPAVLAQMGITGKTLGLPSRALLQIAQKHGDVPLSVIQRLPELMHDPLFAIPHREGGVTLVLDAQTEKGEPIMVGVRDGRVRTVYARNDSDGRTGQEAVAHDVSSALETQGAKVYARNDEALVKTRASSSEGYGANSLYPLARGKARIFTREALVKRFGTDYYQSGDRQRGSFNPDSNTIALLKDADLSTFLHELGHFQLETLASLAADPNAPAEIRADMDALLSWFGVQGDADMTALDRWSTMSLEEKRAGHEQFARGFEAYLFEGKSPSVELQGIFQRFRAWLVNVYRQLRNLNVDLTDEVRDVMDRMLATPDQIQNAEAAASMGMAFRTPEEAAQFGVDWRRYQEQGLQATQDAIDNLETRGVRDMKWLSNAKSRILKGLQKEADSARREIEAEVRREVMAEPVYQAWQFLTAKQGEQVIPGMTPEEEFTAPTAAGKLRTQVLREMYGAGDDAVWRTLSARGMTSDARGSHPDIVAEQFDFDSGDAMVQALAAAEDPETMIRAATDERMLRRFGDTYTAEGLERAANEAIHNEARARFIATEQAALAQATGGRKVLAEAARQFAAQTVARLKVREVSPRQYQAAEARAGRDADRALRAGDLEAAALAKRNQLINNYAVREANQAREDVEKALRYFRRVGDSKTIDPDYRDQIHQLLERYQLRPESAGAADRRTSLAQWIAQQQDKGLDPEIPDAILQDARRISYQDMTVEELRGLRDTVKQIEHFGRLKNKLLMAAEQRDFEAVLGELVNGIEAHAGSNTPEQSTPATDAGVRKLKWHQYFLSHLKVANITQRMDGGETGGPLWSFFARSAQERSNWKQAKQAELTEKMMGIMRPVLARSGKFRSARLRPALGISLTQEQVFAIALNMGNEGNLSRLTTGGIAGQNFTEAQLRQLIDTEMTAEDLQAVQAIWDLMAELTPEAQAKHKRIYGVEMKLIEPLPLVTKHGTLRGGYYPIVYDPRGSTRVEGKNAETLAKDALRAAHTAATTRRSYTKARLDETPYPLLLTMGGVHHGLSQVVHDLAWHEWSMDIGKMLRSTKFEDAVRENYGQDYLNALRKWHEDIVTENVREQAGWERFGVHLRASVSSAAMGYSLLTAIQQPIGLTQSAARIGTGQVFKALTAFMGSPKAQIARARELSAFMRNRSVTRFREIADLKRQIDLTGNRLRQAHAAVAEHAFDLIGWMQTCVDVATWHAAFEKATAEGRSQDAAVAIADQAVIDTQGDGAIQNLSAVQRDRFGRWLTVFYSYLSSALNMVWQTAHSERGMGRKTADLLLLTMIPATLTALVKWGVKPGDDDDDKYWKLVQQILKENISLPLSMFVGIRELSDQAASLMVGEPVFSYQGPGSFRMVAETARLLGQVQQGELDAGLARSAINVAGSVTGLPSAQINRTVQGAQALSEGETDNPAALVFGFQR